MFNIYLTEYNGMFLKHISKALGFLLRYIYMALAHLGIENVAVSIVIFTLIINILMLPLTIKQQKFSKMSSKMQPEMRKIQEKYKDKKDNASMVAQQEEMQALYQKYGTSPTGGCLPTFITMFVFLALYRVIYAIPAYVPEIKEFYTAIAEYTSSNTDALQYLVDNVKELRVVTSGWGDNILAALQGNQNYIIDVFTKFGRANWDELGQFFTGDQLTCIQENAARIKDINYVFGGLNISESPMTKPFPGLAIPIISVILQYVQTHLLMANNKQTMDSNDPMAASMKSMNTMMPLMSGFFSLMFPIGAGIYLITNSAFRIVQQLFVNKYMDTLDIDAEIEKNVMKAQKKREKLHVEVSDGSIKNVASIRTSAKDIAGSTTTSSVDMDNSKEYKEGSIAYIAHMSAKGNEKK